MVDEYLPALERMGLAEGASRSRLRFDPDIMRTVEGCAFIQENGPERVDVKRDLLAKISAAACSDSLIATSSSGILISDIQDAATNPERVLLGHPFNPPHLIPLVEVVGGRLTSEDTINKALTFYGSIGKRPIHIRREVKGHVANRLQAALWREAFYLVEQGIASVKMSTQQSLMVQACVGRCSARSSTYTYPEASAASSMCWSIWGRHLKVGGAT
jgi:3-hydroxyacyl-CoA dehydrogenase